MARASAPLLSPLSQVFGIDLRSLALFRVALGLCVLDDIVVRLCDLTVFHTDYGVVPRIAVLELWDPLIITSLHMVSGGYLYQLALLLVAAAAAFSMTIGYRTRLACVVSFVLLVSVQIRNFAIIQGSDDLLRLVHLWALFLPLGARYSVDATLDPEGAYVVRPDNLRRSNDYLSPATAALLLQSASVYVFGALLKTESSVWVPDGTAVYYALSIDQFATLLTPLLTAVPFFMTVLTYLVWLLELGGGLLLFSPAATAQLRVMVLSFFVVMHLGFEMFLQVGLFPYVSLASLAPFVPGRAWDALALRYWTRRRRRVRIYYDGDCVFCLKVCLLLRTFLLLPPIPIRPAQSDPSLRDIMVYEVSWVVVDPDRRRHVKWDAVITLVRQSPLFRPLGWLLGLPWLDGIGRKAYETIGANRPLLGRVTRRLLPFRRYRFHTWDVTQGIVTVLLLFVLILNVGALQGNGGLVTEPLMRFALLTRLEQRWDMFAPQPLVYDGWYVVAGRLTDGRDVDVLAGAERPATRAKPDRVYAMYPDQKWRKYLVNLTGDEFTSLRLWYAGWLCRQWNEEGDHSALLNEFVIYFMVEPTPPPGGTTTATERPLWYHRCL
jgi:hypothetical protein